jgi:hypothetical protein
MRANNEPNTTKHTTINNKRKTQHTHIVENKKTAKTTKNVQRKREKKNFLLLLFIQQSILFLLYRSVEWECREWFLSSSMSMPLFT